MNKLFRKIMIVIVCVSLMTTTLPSHEVSAEDAPFKVEVKALDHYKQLIEITDTQNGLSEISLMKDGSVIETKVSPDLTPFEVYVNGQYQVVGKNTLGEIVLDQLVTIDDFLSLHVQAIGSGSDLEIISRHNAATIFVNEQVIELGTEIVPNVFSYAYTTANNGEYHVVVRSATNELLEEIIYQEVRHGDEVVATPLLINNEKDLELMIANPKGSYQLNSDIELTSDLLKNIEFSGTLDGNGYVITNIEDRLFNKLTNATIKNIVIEGSLAAVSSNSKIENSGFYLEAQNNEKDIALILESDQTIINNSFVLMNVEAKNVAGFVLNGSATIEHSYVSGYAKAVETLYGFGKDTLVNNSYLSATLQGENRTLFTEKEMTNNFYDIQVNDIEDPRANQMTTNAMTSLDNEHFKSVVNYYPEVTVDFKEKAQNLVKLSTVALQSTSHLAALESNVLWEEAEGLKFNVINANLSGTSAQLIGKTGEVIASNDLGLNRFALTSPSGITEVSAGISTTATTTQLSIPTQKDLYYIVVKSSDTVSTPDSHEVAIESGWKKVYWTGSINRTQLEWHTEYTVYSTDLTTQIPVKTIKTNKGKNGGTLSLSGNYEVGQTVSATLSGVHTFEGQLIWETATILDDNAVWTQVKTETLSSSVVSGSYDVTASEKTKYLRARFVPEINEGYEGELIAKTGNNIKESITKVEIINSRPLVTGKMTLSDELYVKIEPNKLNDVDFSWFHEGSTDAIGTGINYQLKASDIGKSIYVIATAKPDGDFKDSKQSASTSIVEGIKSAKPSAAKIEKVSAEDITVTLSMKEDGLYRFKTVSPLNVETEFPVLARGNTSITITGLTANTMYKVYVQKVGEKGYEDSEYSDDFFEIETELAHVNGDIVLTGNAVYKNTLTASIINTPQLQTGDFEWYRLNDDGERIAESKVTGVTYTLEVADIGKKIEVVYVGTLLYAGEISLSTDAISKEEKTEPTENVSITAFDDTTITVTLPSNTEGEKYIIGVSPTQTGVPIEVIENDVVMVFEADSSYTISGLDRDSEYYISVRYAENETHLRSDWIASDLAINQKTNKKTLEGVIEFKYETTSLTLMKGYTLVAELKPTDAGFNYKGDWKWYRIDTSSNETEITDYILTDDKQGTKYLVPENETTGVKYRAEFTANVGYEGMISSANSEAVTDAVVGQYEKPDATKIEMEMVDESSIKVKMSEGEGQYQFWYKKADTSFFDSMGGFFNNLVNADDGYTIIGNPVYSSTEVLIEGLDRNTSYIVKVQRITDSKGEASDFSYSSDASIFAATDKTEIAGYVTIDGTNRYNEVLTATYHKASYASTGQGLDTDGKWKWYRGSTEIIGETTATYTVKKEDVDQVIKVEYYMPDSSNFKGKSSVSTSVIQKAIGTNPEVTGVTTTQDRTNDKISVEILATKSTLEQKVYYRVQKESASAPDFPNDEEMLKMWAENKTGTIQLTTDTDNEAFIENGKYIIYIFKASSDIQNGSSVIPISFTVGKKAQLGNITFTGRTHVSKEITATLNANNNIQGTWEWYYSTTNYQTTNPTMWTKITSGYSAKENEVSSTLVVPDEAKGRFLKAEFVSTNPNIEGTISSGKSAQSVTKTSTEVLKVSGKGYSGEVITVELSGSDRDFTVPSDFSNKVVQFRKTNGSVDNNQGTITKTTKNTIEFTLRSSIGSEYNNSVIYAVVSQPDRNIYTNEDGSQLSGSGYLYSDSSTNIPFLYGIPIRNSSELLAFMQASGSYQSRSATYVLTNNINMSGQPKANVSSTTFTGIFDGNFHTISYAKNPLIYSVMGTSSRYAEVKNVLFANGNIESLSGALQYQTGAIASKVGHYTKINKIFASNTTVNVEQNGGFITGFVDADTSGLDPLRGTVSISECGVAGGGLIKTSGVGASVGGLAGFAPSGIITDNFSVANRIKARGSYVAGFVGHGSRNGGDNIQRNYTTAKFDFTDNNGNHAVSHVGGIIADYADNPSPSGVTLYRNYYDKQVVNNAKVDAASVGKSGRGTGKNTADMIGTKLQSDFGNTVWTYRSGYYPVLTWVKDHPAAILYTSTRGGFISVDGLTSVADMFGGSISGSIMIPPELQIANFTVKSSDSSILKVVNNTIIPVGSVNSKATITITYSEPDPTIGGSASNTYDFTVKKQLGSFNSVAVEGEARYGDTLKATTVGATATSFQWYKRKSGESTRVAISGANKATYDVKPEDIGYQLSVEVGATNYAKTMSKYTSIVISAAPTKGPAKVSTTDSSITIKQDGVAGIKYEFAYATSSNANKTIVSGIFGATDQVVVDRMARNTSYQWFTRVAAGTGYEASDWSSPSTIATEKTKLVGEVTLGTNLNNGSSLSMSFPSTNNQIGTWKIERIGPDDGVVAIISENYSSNNTANYTLTAADVGMRIRATFTGSNDYQGSKSAVSGTVRKSNVGVPAIPTIVSSTADSIDVRVVANGNIDLGYAEEIGGTINVALSNQSANTNLTINGLNRNKNYYIYARLSETSSSEASAWSSAVNGMTQKVEVANSIITPTEDLVTGSMLVVNAPITNSEVSTGTWKVERINIGVTTTISPSNYHTSPVDGSLNYVLSPKDAQNVIRVTFTGNDDFKGSVSMETREIGLGEQTVVGMASAVTVSNAKEYEFDVMAVDGVDTYQFGYALTSDSVINEVAATAGAGKIITINNLLRNTVYDVYIRKAEKVGYKASEWVKIVQGKTIKSPLTGTIKYNISSAGSLLPPKIGVASIGVTYKAEYHPGNYGQTGDDTNAGTWQWYADENMIPNATSDTYTVEPMNGDPEISVRYVANENSEFSSYRSASIGTLTKPKFSAPSLPIVVAVAEDGQSGSKLSITSSDFTDVYYYVQKSSNSKVPAVVGTEKVIDNAAKENQWFKATATNIINLDPNTEYVVYAARLEDTANQASGVISHRSVKTVKENLGLLTKSVIVEADTNAIWKTAQAKELRISNDSKAPTGVWQYYVSLTPSIEISWSNITFEVTSVEGKTDEYAYARINVPMKYTNDYTVRAVFIGRGEYQGRKEYTATQPLAGKPLNGKVELNLGPVAEVLVPIQANYVSLDGSAVDDANGTWAWYREELVGSGVFVEIETPLQTGVVGNYTPTGEDTGKKIYATYSGATNGIYSGSVPSEIVNDVMRSNQNDPTGLALKQVNGLTVQMTLPSNYKTDGKTIPEVVLEYRVKGDATGPWTINEVSNSWIGKRNKLLAHTEYEIRAKFTGTNEYAPSKYTENITITTGSESFTESNLKVVAPLVIKPNDIIEMSYSGEGFDEGYFAIERSDGTIANVKIDGTIVGNEIKATYVVDKDDEANNIIVKYQAKDDAKRFGGFVEKSTSEVIKIKNPAVAMKHTLENIRLEESKLKVQVSDDYEYVLTDSATLVDENSSAWKKLPAMTDGYYIFDNLAVGKSYYLHARLAETADYNPSEQSVSDALQPWVRTTYSIDYKLDGGVNSAANPTEYTEMSQTIILEDASKLGYTFNGWTLIDTEQPLKGIEIASGSEGAKAFTAHWTINEYTVTFDSMGGNAQTPLVKDYDMELGVLPLPIKEGYTFVGWFDAQTGGNQIMSTAKMPATDSTVYARWTINTYTVSFNSMGGSNDNATLTRDFNVALGDLPPTNREGYTFVGWFDAQQGGNQITETTKMPSSDLQAYAQWTINAYTITFDEQGGSTVLPKEVNFGEPFGAIPGSSRSGYSFNGWFTEQVGGIMIDETNIMKAANMTVYAQWDPTVYTITYDMDGGINDSANPTSFTIETPTFALNRPTKEGFGFEGWTSVDDLVPTKKIEIAIGSITDRVYTAVWGVIKYEVTFETNGGTAIDTQEIEHSGLVIEPSAAPTRDGYTFAGWYSDEALTNPWDFATNTVVASTTIYAKWNLNTYTINYTLDGGVVSNNPTNYTIETATFTLNNPQKTGYDFIGWTTATNTVPQTNVEIALGTFGDLSFTANYKLKEFTVSFVTNSTDLIGDQIVEYGKKVTKPQDPNKDGYRFAGWYTDEAFTTAWNFSTDNVMNAMSLYAKYTEILQQVTANVSTNSTVEKNSTITLSAKAGATIYYTMDGSEPNDRSSLYSGPITISNNVVIKAIAQMDGYVDSAVATYSYFIRGDFTLVTSDGVSTTTSTDQLIEAVVTETEYRQYLRGTDVNIEITKTGIVIVEDEFILAALDGDTIGDSFEVRIFKTVGSNSTEEVVNLNHEILLVNDVPTQLAAPSGIKRTFGMIKVLIDGAVRVTDLDTNQNTVTIDILQAGSYILSYKDVVLPPAPQPTVAPVPTAKPSSSPKPTTSPTVEPSEQPDENGSFTSGGTKVTADELLEEFKDTELNKNSYAYKNGYTVASLIAELTSPNSEQLLDDVVRTSAIGTKIKTNRNNQLSETAMKNSRELILSVLEPNEIVKALTSVTLTLNLEVNYLESQTSEVLTKLEIKDKEQLYAVDIQLYKVFENEEAVAVTRSITPIEISLLDIQSGQLAEFVALTETGQLVVYEDIDDQDKQFSFKTTELSLKGVVVKTIVAETNNWIWLISIVSALVLCLGLTGFYIIKKKSTKA